MKRTATLVLVMLAMSASAAVDARALAHEGQKTQWAPTRDFSNLNARAVFGGESRRATSCYAGEAWETAAGEKDWQYAAGNPMSFTDPDGRDAAECIRKGLRWEDQAWTTDSADCMTSSSPRRIELALRARDATSPSAVAKTTGDYLDYVNTDEMVRGTVGRPLFFATAAASGAGLAAGCAITPGCGAVALTVGAGGVAASPDPGAALMSPVRACGNALTSGAGDATAADAECGSALGGALFGAQANSHFLSQTGQNAKLGFSPGALVLRRTPEGPVFLGLAESPAWASGAKPSAAAAAPFVTMAAANADRTSPQLKWQRPKEATATRYRWVNYFMPEGNFVKATLEEGALSMTILSPKQNALARRGSQMFKDVFDHFGGDRIRAFAGEWVQNSKFKDNYEEFAANLAKGMSEQDAAWSTWTGRQLKARGFKRVEVRRPEPGVVLPRFSRE